MWRPEKMAQITINIYYVVNASLKIVLFILQDY